MASGFPEEPLPLNGSVVYPNPSRDVVLVRFTLEASKPIVIELLDLLGNTSKVIENRVLEPREYVYTIDLTDVTAGVYYLRIKAGKKRFNENIVVR